jgi:hypothetical protein
MNNKTAVALAVAVAIAGIASPASAQASHHHTRQTRTYDRGAQSYDYAAQPSQAASVADPRWTPQTAGAGSLGYNQHNEVKN